MERKTKSTAKETDEAAPADEAASSDQAAPSEQADISAEAIQLTAEERSERADSLIRSHVIAGAASGIIPIPGVDILASFGTQLNLIRKLADLYDVPFRENAAKSAITALLAAFGGVGAGALIAMSFIKIIPFVGTAAGIAGTSASLGAFTFAVGKVFQQHFESDGTFLDFNAGAYRDHFRNMIKRREKIAEA